MPFTFEKESLESRKHPRTLSYHRMMIRIDSEKKKQKFSFCEADLSSYLLLFYTIFALFGHFHVYLTPQRGYRMKEALSRKKLGWKVRYGDVLYSPKRISPYPLQFLELIRLLSSQNVFFSRFFMLKS